VKIGVDLEDLPGSKRLQFYPENGKIFSNYCESAMLKGGSMRMRAFLSLGVVLLLAVPVLSAERMVLIEDFTQNG
jgi:hypothetical protein